MSKKRKVFYGADKEYSVDGAAGYKLRFDEDDNPIIDSAAVAAGLFPQSALDAQNARAAAASAHRNKNEKITHVLTAEVKRVYTTDLIAGAADTAPIIKKNEYSERENAMRARRNRCELYRLLTTSGDESLGMLDMYIKLAHQSLSAEGVYPMDGALHGDAQVADAMYQYILNHRHDVAIKKAYILFALYISTEFATVFCPAPPPSSIGSDGDGESASAGAGKFVVNPTELSEFIHGVDSPFTELVSSFLVCELDSKMFVAMVAMEWAKFCPWENADVWSNMAVAQPSAEVRLLITSAGVGAGADAQQVDVSSRHFFLTGARDVKHEDADSVGGAIMAIGDGGGDE
jgi:hypothetical protein